jgi:predicted amidophosphoribosyltransferase
MTTEQGTWFALQSLPTGGLNPKICGCGQDLDQSARAHCPRCGSAVRSAPATKKFQGWV